MNRKLQAWLSLFASAAIVAIAPQAARAQSATAAPAQPAQSEPAKKDETEATTDESTAEEVVVTGSRIRRTNFDSAAPVEIITAERAALAGLVSTEEILRGSTAASGEQINDAFQGFLLDGGPGAQQVSLRGLGAQRTLVLVNGR